MRTDIGLSSFRIAEEIGRGGMGIVYRGEHRTTGVSVAIKVVLRESDPARRERFRHEVRSHARLLHPGIVYLFEYGAVDREQAEATGIDLPRGSPYVAMEFADRGTVRDAMPVSDWRTLRSILVQVLDALAHAHARGVIHRDLKPENLLVFEADGEPSARTIKLADFGIAHALDRNSTGGENRGSSAAGTVTYMAPEQFRGEWRRYGPWTDLYGLGCAAWELVCGSPPFIAETSHAVAVRALRAPRPALEPQFPVPDGLERWLRRTIAIDPDDRFQRAADALWALPGRDSGPEPIDETPAPDRSPVRIRSHRGRTLSALENDEPETDGPDLAPTATAESNPPQSPEEREASAFDAPPPRAPIARSLERREPDPLPSQLVGAGLGLFGLREPPFVDRSEECDRIWETLRSVAEEDRPGAVFIVGETGTGKSRLAQWAATRAHELGAARVMRARYTASGGGDEGLKGALERRLRTTEMARDRVFEHLRETLPRLPDPDERWRERDARALTEYLRPTADDTGDVVGPSYRFASADQKHALLVRTLRRFACKRPLLLWLDDLQWGPEGRSVLNHLGAESTNSAPILAVATLRPDIVRNDPEVEREILDLEERLSPVRLPVEALSEDHQRSLIRGLLPLQDELADQLATRTEGRPLFAMQLLAHKVERADLEIGDGGFRVADGGALELPDDIQEVWTERITRLLEAYPSDSRGPLRESLECAAVLGREITDAEWGAICERVGASRSDELRDDMLESGLAEPTNRGWAFTHGLLVESLEQRARSNGRLERHHRRCAELLAALAPDLSDATVARRAGHWVAAGEPSRALAPFLEASKRAWQTGDYRRQKSLLERRGRLLEDLGLPETDPRSLENAIDLASVQLILGRDPDDVLGRLEESCRRAERADHHRLLARAHRAMARCLERAGDRSSTVRALRETVRHAERSDARDELVDARIQWGWTEYSRGRLADARDQFSSAESRAFDSENHHGEIQARYGLACVAVSRGEDARATELFEQTLEECEEAGYRELVARCRNGLGELARFRGDAPEARRHYRRYRDLARELNLTRFMVPDLTLAQVELMDGEYDTAAEHLNRAERHLEERARGPDRTHITNVMWLAHAAGVGDWSRFDELLSPYDDGWPERARLIKDHPWVLEIAGDAAGEHGKARRAKRAWSLSRSLWNRLEDPKAVERLDRKLEEI